MLDSHQQAVISFVRLHGRQAAISTVPVLLAVWVQRRMALEVLRRLCCCPAEFGGHRMAAAVIFLHGSGDTGPGVQAGAS